MTDVTSPPVVGADPWGTQLNSYLAFIEDRVATLEGVPTGAAMSFNFTPETDMFAVRAGFAPGEMRLDSADQEAATAVMASVVTDGGADARLALSSAVPGTVLVLQQSGAVNQYAMATMSGEPVDMGDHFMLPISSLRLASNPLVQGRTGLSAAGISGETTGPPGPTGPQGPPGPQGVAGAPGAQGVVGAQGAEGPQGVQGPVGEDGAQGPQGAEGPAGVIGPIGPPGGGTLQSIWNWQSAPLTDVPGNGKVGVDTDKPADATQFFISARDGQNVDQTFAILQLKAGDHILLQVKTDATLFQRYLVTAATDPLVIAATGYAVGITQSEGVTNGSEPPGGADVLVAFQFSPEPGAQGPPGPQGPQGAEGPQGVEGRAGATGTQGPQGFVGPQGTKGDAGAQGPQGVKGDTGIQGAQGAQGLKGDTGLQGTPGAKGDTGAQGAQGPQGVQGAQGPQGAQGAQGSQGAQGVQGPPGSIVTSQSTTRATVVNTSAEAVLGDIPIAAIAAGQVFSLDVWGDILNTAANYGYIFRLRQGGLTGQLLFDMASQSIAANASPRNWSGRVILVGVDATTVDLTMTHGIGAASAPSRMTAPTLVNGVSPSVTGFNVATTLTLTVQIATANAGANARLLGYFLRKVG